MKKLILTVAVIAGAVMMACTGTAKEESPAAAITAKIQNCTNPDSLKAYVQEAKDYAATLVSEGKIEQAKEYMAKIEPVVKEKAPALASTLATVETALDKVSDTAAEKTDSVKSAVADSINGKVDAARQSVGDAIEGAAKDAADKAGEVADKAGEAVSNAADKAKDAAADAAQSAADKLKGIGK